MNILTYIAFVKLRIMLVCVVLTLGLGMPTYMQIQARTSRASPFSEGPTTLHAHGANGLSNLPRLGLDALYINQVLEEDTQSGVSFVRVGRAWSSVEPVRTDPPTYLWGGYDGLFNRLSEHGLAPVVLVLGCPLWACPDPNGPIYDDKYDEFGEFMGVMAERYSQPAYNVHFYEFWNEPDAAGGPNRQLGWGMHPDKYAQMLGAAYPSIKAADPESVIVMGGLAYDFWFDQGGPFNPDFLSDVLDHGGAQYLDAMAFHYYINNAHGWTNIGLKTAAVRAEMNDHGADLPMIVTESGLTSSPDFGSSEAIQARYLVQMISHAAASRLLAVTWYTDRDTLIPNPGQDVFALSGLLRPDDSIKPSYIAMQTLSREVGYGAYHYRSGAADGVVDTLEGYRFRSADGERQVSVVWNNADPSSTITIPASQAADFRRAVSLYGQEVATAPGPDGTRLVEVGLDPVYLEWNSLFSDVTVGSTFYPYVMCLVGRGAISGYADGTFRPANNVTRAQLAKVVSNAAGFSEPVTVQSFEDVPPGSTFYDFVGRLASRGYVSGYACSGASEPCVPPLNLPYFKPNANVTRGQAAKIVSEAAGFNDVPASQQFEDVAQGSTFYAYIYRLVSRSIMQGYACGGQGEPCGGGSLPYFRPSNTATRGQASKVVANAFFPNCQSLVGVPSAGRD
jgi:hypothetical protein